MGFGWGTDAATATAPFGVDVTASVMVAMRDGVRLATDVYRPTHQGRLVETPLPAILLRTPYDKRFFEKGWARHFARHGYVALVQDCRGTFSSEGELDLFVNEAHDGADTLAWVDAQEWSNGSVGTWGGSYAGYTQMSAATQSPSNLVSMVPVQCATHSWRSSVRHAGAFELRWMAWAFWHAAVNRRPLEPDEAWKSAALSQPASAVRDWLTRLPLREHTTPLRLAPDYERWLLRLMRTSDEDEFWRQPGLAPLLHLDGFPKCSVLLIGSWYDSYARSTIEWYEAMRSDGRFDVRLLMGPWIHGVLDQQVSGDVDLGFDAPIKDLRQLHLRWFDATMRGAATASDQLCRADDPLMALEAMSRPGQHEGLSVSTDEPSVHADDSVPPVDPEPIRYFVMGGGAGDRTSAGNLAHGGGWCSSRHWPPSGVLEETWWLHGDGQLVDRPTEVAESATTFRFDPARPVPSIGGNVSSLMDLRPPPVQMASSRQAGGVLQAVNVVEPGGFDQVESSRWYGCQSPYLPLASRPDVLVWRSEALATAVELIGTVRVHLWFSTTAVDTDVTAKLIDEYPPSQAHPHGYALNLADSVVRLRYRDGSPAQFVRPGEIVEVTIELYPTANRFAAGHRVRLDVSSSNFPRFDVNPNTGEALSQERRRLPADNTVYHDRRGPSHVVLPLRHAASVPATMT